MRKGLTMTRAQAEAHALRHGYSLEAGGKVKTAEKASDANTGIVEPRDRMNKTEREFGLILEARKRRGELDHYQYEGISLPWGCDPETGKMMWYTPDFISIIDSQIGRGFMSITVIEVKGGHIFDRDIVRFKGCRAHWGDRIRFEMHQKKAGEWRRIH